MRVNTISTEFKYIVRVNGLVGILGVFVFDEGIREGISLLETDTFNGAILFELFSEIVFGKLNQQDLLQQYLSQKRRFQCCHLYLFCLNPLVNNFKLNILYQIIFSQFIMPFQALFILSSHKNYHLILNLIIECEMLYNLF